jgi:mRNA interferase RelE/StbE
VYAVVILKSAQKEIRALDASMIARVIAAVRTLAATPRPAGCKKLVGATDLWRIRLGDYRIVYAIDDGAQTVEVRVVRHRSAAYR